MSNWNHVSSKLGNIPASTRSIAKEVYDAAARNGHEVWFMWGAGSSGEHSTGRALDFMVRNKAAGDFIRNYVWTHRSRLRLQHVIWWQRIRSTTNQPGVDRLMADRGNSTANHYDHPHVFVRPGSYQPPKGSSSTSKPAPKPSGKKSVSVLASEVIAGKWGNNPSRAQRLRAAGYNPAAVQAEVNRRLRGTSTAARRKTTAQLATEVIRGNWGNGAERVRRLRVAGYNPATVQAEVNRRLR